MASGLRFAHERACICWHPYRYKLEIPSNNFENTKRTERGPLLIFEFLDYLSPAYPEKPNSGRLNPFRSSTGLSTSIESFQRGKSSNLGRELHERPGKYGR